MSTQNNPVLGYTKCEAGGRATVHQTKRGKGRFLYTRCDCCGVDQRTGATVQTRLYRETEWLGEVPEAPPNLLTTEKQPENEPKSQPNVVPVEPDFEPKKEPESQPKQEPKGLGLVALIGGCLGVLGLIMSKGVGR